MRKASTDTEDTEQRGVQPLVQLQSPSLAWLVAIEEGGTGKYHIFFWPHKPQESEVKLLCRGDYHPQQRDRIHFIPMQWPTIAWPERKRIMNQFLVLEAVADGQMGPDMEYSNWWVLLTHLMKIVFEAGVKKGQELTITK